VADEGLVEARLDPWTGAARNAPRVAMAADRIGSMPSMAVSDLMSFL